LTATREARALGYARVVLGMIFLARTTPLLSFVGGPFGAQAYPLLGWPTAEWTLAFPGASLPAWLVASLCVLRTVAAVLFACGVRARIAGVVAAGCGYLVAAQDRFAFINSFHVLFLATFVIALTSAPSTVALVPDREAHGEVDSSVRFVSVVLASIYFWAGLAKLQPDWLSGHALLAQARAGAFAGPLGALLERAPLRVVGSLAVPVLELAVAALLLAGRRRPAILLGLLFHLIVELTVKPDMLGWQMAVLLLAIWPRPTETVAAKRPEVTEQV
jgi:hypothetical protein